MKRLFGDNSGSLQMTDTNNQASDLGQQQTLVQLNIPNHLTGWQADHEIILSCFRLDFLIS